MSQPNGNYSYLSLVGPWPLQVNIADDVAPGAMLFWDAGSKTHRPLTDPVNGNLFSGVALGEFPPSSNIDNGQITEDPTVPASVAKGDLHQWFGTDGETLTFGDALYVGADEFTVVKAVPGGTDAADIIGFFWPDDGNDQVVVAGDKVQVRTRVNWPSPDLA